MLRNSCCVQHPQSGILCLFVVNLCLLVVILLTFFGCFVSLWLFCVALWHLLVVNLCLLWSSCISLWSLTLSLWLFCVFLSFWLLLVVDLCLYVVVLCLLQTTLCIFVVVLCLFVILALTGGPFVSLCSRFVSPSDHFVYLCGCLIDWSNRKCYQSLDNEVLSCCPFPCTRCDHSLWPRPRLPLFPSFRSFLTLWKRRKRTRKESALILWDLINSIYSYCLDSLKVLGSAFSGSISHNIVREAMVMHEGAGTQFIPEQVLSVR